MSTSVSAQRRRRDAFSSRFASSVPFHAWSPSIAQLHSALSRSLPSRRGERVAAAEGGEGLGRQHLALRLARGAGVRGERHRPGLPGVAEVAAQRGQRAARLRRVDRAAEAGERRVDETDRRRALRVPVPDRRREPLDLTRAVRAEIPVGAEGQDVPERVGRAEPLEAREPLPADALRVLEERAPLGVVVSAARPRVERDADAAAVGPLEDEQRRHLEAAPLGVVVEEGHGQPAHARPGQEARPHPRGARAAPCGARRRSGCPRRARGGARGRATAGRPPRSGAPEGVAQEGAEGDPALAKPPDELVLPLRVVLEEREGLVRDGHRVPVAVPLGLAVRAGSSRRGASGRARPCSFGWPSRRSPTCSRRRCRSRRGSSTGEAGRAGRRKRRPRAGRRRESTEGAWARDPADQADGRRGRDYQRWSNGISGVGPTTGSRSTSSSRSGTRRRGSPSPCRGRRSSDRSRRTGSRSSRGRRTRRARIGPSASRRT